MVVIQVSGSSSTMSGRKVLNSNRKLYGARSVSPPNGSPSAQLPRRALIGEQQQQQQLSEEQRHEVKEAFDLFDMDKDGHIDYHELKVAMRALGFDMPKEAVLRIINEHSKNGSTNGRGLIGYEDFVRVMTRHILERDPLDEIRHAFALFDDDGTGKISLRNLRRVAKELGENLDEEELQAMIDEFDLDQDGEISEEEFIAIVSG